MNADQITGIVRAVVPALLAYAVGRGWISESSVGEITAAITAVGAALWSIWTNKSGKTIS